MLLASEESSLLDATLDVERVEQNSSTGTELARPRRRHDP
jgi:hypothetical protein